MQFAGTSGYQADATTGLLLLGHRYYDPSIGRFLSSDPAQAGSNWYAYCDNNPLVRVDPTGLDPTVGNPWLPWTWSKGDWRQVGRGIQQWGDGEMSIVTVLIPIKPLKLIGIDPFEDVAPTDRSPVRWGEDPSCPGFYGPVDNPITVGGVVGATIGGVSFGGAISWGIGRIIRYVARK